MKEKHLWICLVVFLVLVVGHVINQPQDENEKTNSIEKLDYSKPIFTTYRTIVCPLSVLSDVRADHGPERVARMFELPWGRSSEAEKLGCMELRPDLVVKATPFLDGNATVEIPGIEGVGLFTPEDELTNRVPGQSDATRTSLASPHINKAPESPLPPASDSVRLLVTTPDYWHRHGEPILKGFVAAASDSKGFGAIICPDENAMALALNHEVPNGVSGASRNEDDPGVWLKPYGCSYLPPGAGMVSQGGNATNALAIVTAKFTDGTTISGVTFPSMIVQNQEQREQTERQTMEEQQIAQQAQREKEQAQQKRYEEIMLPEDQRHAAAVNREEGRHASMMGILNSSRDSLMSMHPGPSNKAQLLYQNQVNVQQEGARYDAAVQQENTIYMRRSQEARDQAAQPQAFAPTQESEKPTVPPENQSNGLQTSYSAFAAQLQSIVVNRGFQTTGKTWLVDADSNGNKLLIQAAVCKNVPDGHCQKLFIAFNERFLGTDTYRPSWAVHDVIQEGVGKFSAVYEDLSDPTQQLRPTRVIYTWDGRKLTMSGTPPTRTKTP